MPHFPMKWVRAVLQTACDPQAPLRFDEVDTMEDVLCAFAFEAGTQIVEAENLAHLLGCTDGYFEARKVCLDQHCGHPCTRCEGA